MILTKCLNVLLEEIYQLKQKNYKTLYQKVHLIFLSSSKCHPILLLVILRYGILFLIINMALLQSNILQLSEEFKNILTQDEQQKQYLLQVVSDYRSHFSS